MDLSIKKKKKETISGYDLVTTPEDREDEVIMERILRRRKYSTGMYRLILHPVEFLTEKPVNIMLLSGPIAIIVFVYGFLVAVLSGGIGSLLTSMFIDDVILTSLFIAVVPLAILDLRENMRVNSIEYALPNFFRDIAGMRESGMTLPGAIHLISGSEYGALTPYVRKLDYQMSWNFQFIDAIKAMGSDLHNPLMERSVDLIARATEAGGDIVEVLQAAARDSLEFVSLKTDRKNNMIIYVIIILVAFAVFLFVIYVLVSAFLKTMVTLGTDSGGSAGAAGFNLGGFDLNLYIRIFSHAAMFQGFFSGLAAGVMGEGRITAGFKYSIIMLLMAWVVFRFMV
ncbi:MAG: type II secretion system F family protein [Methanospirillaceae archaeon]|nr:type II secretion system F family protein [Methanospirillaceae archaeon]